MQRYSSGRQVDMSFIALKTHAIKELKETLGTDSKENADMCSSNGMDIAQGTLLIHGKSQCDMKADAVGAELSQIFQEVAIERPNTAMPDVELVNDCSAKHTVDILKVGSRNNGSVAKERGKESKSENKDLYSTKPNKLATLLARKGQTLAPPTKLVKCMAQAVTQTQNMHEETENCKPLTKVLHSKNNVNNLASKCSNTTKSSSPKFTIARPFAFATDKRAEERPIAIVPSYPSDFPQDVKNLRQQRFFVAKSNHSDKVRPPVSQDLKVQTNATGFNFQSDERAKKRKAFYSRLQEKFNTKEEEKAQMQARTEKENEEALKVLRRSLTFKASPMPSFYQEGPPLKFELKKIPTTQAKSPKFSIRGRCVGSESVSNLVCKEVELSHSNEHPQHRYSDIVDVLHKSKDGLTERLAKCSLLSSPGEQSLDSNPCPLSSNQGADATDKENEGNHEETECMNNNQKPKEGTTARQLVKGAVTKASSERYQSKCSSNVLRNCANKGSPVSSSRPNSMKPKVQPLPFDVKEDLSPMSNKTTKKERLKALTPYFRKRESIGSGRKLTTALLAQEVASALNADFKVGT